MANSPAQFYIAAGVVIEHKRRFLLVQQKKATVRGLWNLPAGKVEEGDTIESAAAREAKEETGYDVEILKSLGVFHRKGEKTVKCAFEARIVGGELKIPRGEIMDARWFALEELESMPGQLRNSYWVLGAIRAAKANASRAD